MRVGVVDHDGAQYVGLPAYHPDHLAVVRSMTTDPPTRPYRSQSDAPHE